MAREGSGRGVGRARARARVEARAEPAADRAARAPGNPGIAALGPCHPVRAEDAEGLLALARALAIDLVVSAPRRRSSPASPTRFGSAASRCSGRAPRPRGSKARSASRRRCMQAAGVPTPEALAVARPPCVVKADGLAAGKGVFVCRTQDELDAALRAVPALGDDFVVEELLEGDELSVFAICDGVTRARPPAGTRLQARVRRRRRAEHRRHGRVLAGPARRARARGARRGRCTSRCFESSRGAARRSSDSSTRA